MVLTLRGPRSRRDSITTNVVVALTSYIDEMRIPKRQLDIHSTDDLGTEGDPVLSQLGGRAINPSNAHVLQATVSGGVRTYIARQYE